MWKNTLITYLYHHGIDGIQYQLARDIYSWIQESVVVIFDEKISKLFRKGIKLHTKNISGILFAVMHNVKIEKIVQHSENEIYTDDDSFYDLYTYIDGEIILVEHYDYNDINERVYKVIHNIVWINDIKVGIYRRK